MNRFRLPLTAIGLALFCRLPVGAQTARPVKAPQIKFTAEDFAALDAAGG